MKPMTMMFTAGLVALALSACGSESDTATPPAPTSTSPSAAVPTSVSTQFNETDVMFAQMMIPHHRQAIDMAKLVEGRASDPEVTTLATAIRTAQDPEIQTMATWLTTWGQDVPTGSMPGMDHGSHGGMPGMMSEADMTRLESLSGTAFDRAWLTMMVAHHQGAVQMAAQEQKYGVNPDGVALARKIRADQATEISTMTRLLGTS